MKIPNLWFTQGQKTLWLWCALGCLVLVSCPKNAWAQFPRCTDVCSADADCSTACTFSDGAATTCGAVNSCKAGGSSGGGGGTPAPGSGQIFCNDISPANQCGGGFTSSANADSSGYCFWAYLSGIGWRFGCNRYWVGTRDQSRPIYAIEIFSPNSSVCYWAHFSDIGWQFGCDGQVVGQMGKGLQAIEVLPSAGDVFYQGWLQDLAESQGIKSDGQILGTTGQSRRLEAFRIW